MVSDLSEDADIFYPLWHLPLFVMIDRFRRGEPNAQNVAGQVEKIHYSHDNLGKHPKEAMFFHYFMRKNNAYQSAQLSFDQHAQRI